MKETTCGVCGKGIQYTTKRPLKCEDCKAKKETKPRKKRSRKYPQNKNTGGEVLMFSILDKILSDYEYVNHGYYSFIRSPKNKELQIDRYYPGLRLGFEFDGKQHHQFEKWIHKSVKTFEYYQECDRLKEIGCRKHGVTLVRVDYKDKVSEELIRKKIQEANPELYKRLK